MTAQEFESLLRQMWDSAPAPDFILGPWWFPHFERLELAEIAERKIREGFGRNSGE